MRGLRSVVTLLVCGVVTATGPVWAADAALPTVRVATLAFGTVAWELDTLAHHGLDRPVGIRVELVPVASGNAATIALQGGAADVIVTDWLWVARARGEGRPYQFMAHSQALGGIMVPADSDIRTLSDLAGKRLGVAGGNADKSWLMVQHLARQQGLDLADVARVEFAAPPTLNELMRRGRLDAVLNYWHFNARLKSAGGRELLGMAKVLDHLDMPTGLPMLGWVFADAYAMAHPDRLAAFARASLAAKQRLQHDDGEWARLRPRMKVTDDAEFTALVEAYRAGIVSPLRPVDEAAASRLWALMADLGGREVTGSAGSSWPEGVFWSAPK